MQTFLYVDSLYKKTYQPKMKFGNPQIEKNGSTKMRHVVKPSYVLKAAQKEINHCLQKIPLMNSMYGGVPGKNNVLNALQHIDNIFFLTIDLKNFFGNITNTQVHQALIDHGFTWQEARYITRITTLHGSLPQGAPTSSVLANLCFENTALMLEAFCKERNITFTIFVDDLTFSSSKYFKHYTDQIIEILYNNSFYINQDKVHYKKHRCEITGLIVKKGKLSLPKDMLNHINKPAIKRYANAVAKQYNEYMLLKQQTTRLFRIGTPDKEFDSDK